MFLLNLSLGEFIALFGSLSGIVVALYLLDRSKKRLVVATLRFWNAAQQPTEVKHRRRIQQPWSLLLQIVSMCLLLLAIGQLRWGSRETGSRDHVLILETSAWMGARTRQGTLMDEARGAALAWIRSLPASDRVMLVRADSLSTPATRFEANRQVLEDAVRQSRPGSSALNLDQAFDFARQVQRLRTQRDGEVVFIGTGRLPETESVAARPAPTNLRVLPISTTVENCGLRKVGLRRSATNPDEWEIFISAKNYGASVRTVPLAVQLGDAPVGSRVLTLKPGAEEESTFSFRTRAAGWVEARLLTRDAFPQDDRAVLELPS